MATGRPHVPHDPQLETAVVGSIIARWATCTTIRPHHFYVPACRQVLAGWIAAGRPVGYVAIMGDDRGLAAYLEFEGLVGALERRWPGQGLRLAIYAGVIAQRAPVTTRDDVARLRLLAARRHRLGQLMDEHDRIREAS